MEKYGVEIDKESVAHETAKCPSCGTSLTNTHPPLCSNCGTKFFEKRFTVDRTNVMAENFRSLYGTPPEEEK